MVHRIKSYPSSQAAAAQRANRRRRKQHFRNFKKKNLNLLKEALVDKVSVVRVKCEMHYLTLEYITGDKKIMYGSFYDADRRLRSRLFYRPSPCTIVNLFYFDKILTDTDGNYLLFCEKLEEVPEKQYKNPVKYVEKLFEKDENEIKRVSKYILEGQNIQDAKRLSR
jgi:DNA-binding LytR/AlgR family response regulator